MNGLKNNIMTNHSLNILWPTLLLVSLYALPSALWAQEPPEPEGEIYLQSRVTGHQEQPNVVSIVPWKQAERLETVELGESDELTELFPHLEPEEFVRALYFAGQLNP